MAIKVANEILETDDRNVVVYVNCNYIDSFDDFAEKVLQQIYHHPLNNPIPAMKQRLKSNTFHTILLLDNFEYLSHLNDPKEETRVETFIEEIVTSCRNVKLLVTSSVFDDGVFPDLGRERIELAQFQLEESIQLLKKVSGEKYVDNDFVKKLTDICSGIPLVLYTLMASNVDLVSRVQQMCSFPPEVQFEYLKKIKAAPKKRKIDVCLDVSFEKLKTQEEKETLVRLALLRGRFTPAGAAKVFHSAELSEGQFIDHVLELANRSLLEKNIICGRPHLYTFLSVIRQYCKRKASDKQFKEVFLDGQNRFIDHFLAFLKDTFKTFLSTNAPRAITDFLQEEENVMQLREWIDKGEMDEERVKRGIDIFNTVGELLAKMMGKTKFKSLYESLTKKCQDMGDQGRLSECLTSLGINEVFHFSCSPGLCDKASTRAKEYLEQADNIQATLGIDEGNSRAQCLAKLGRCLAKEERTRELGKSKIEEAIRIRVKASEAPGDAEGGENVCKVMLGATNNDMAGEFISGETKKISKGCNFPLRFYIRSLKDSK